MRSFEEESKLTLLRSSSILRSSSKLAAARRTLSRRLEEAALGRLLTALRASKGSSPLQSMRSRRSKRSLHRRRRDRPKWALGLLRRRQQMSKKKPPRGVYLFAVLDGWMEAGLPACGLPVGRCQRSSKPPQSPLAPQLPRFKGRPRAQKIRSQSRSAE